MEYQVQIIGKSRKKTNLFIENRFEIPSGNFEHNKPRSQWNSIANPWNFTTKQTTKQTEVKNSITLAHPYLAGKPCCKFS